MITEALGQLSELSKTTPCNAEINLPNLSNTTNEIIQKI